MTGPSTRDLLRVDWLGEGDIFAVRQRGREVAAALGLQAQDQVRVATALSEVGRVVLADDEAVSVRFALAPADGQGRAGLEIIVTTPTRPPEGSPGAVTGLAAARRLLDEIVVRQAEGGWTVTLTKRLPQHAQLDDGTVRRIRRRMAALGPATPLDELREQNAELVRTLDQLSARQQELLQVNAELEETNRGVLAMYAQLSGELEETNRGVVALYAELDEKGQQLAEANEAKSRFLRNISHELRTPVHSIIGLGDLLVEGPLDAEQRRQVDYLRGSAQSLLGLVNELLDLARAESGHVDLHLEDVDLAAVFAGLRGTLRPVAENRGIALLVDDPEVRTVRTDADLLARVLRNLLMNALKFTERGHVRMTAVRRESGQHVEIAVTDTGIGIPPEFAERVFEEFFQVPHRLQQAGAGTGLGLPYARRLCARAGEPVVIQPGGAPLAQFWKAGAEYLTEDATPEAWAPLLARAPIGPATWYTHPVREASGRVTGGLAIALTGRGGLLSADEERLAGQLADAVAIALAKLRAYAQEHRTALALQRAMLPDRLPVVPGLTFAARYRASDDLLSVGGDFYDSFVLQNGHVVVVIGDVQGHSLHAATVMAELRFSLRAYLFEGHDVAVVLGLLNRLLMTNHPEVTATLVLLVVDPSLATVRVANAGHLPPLLMDGGGARYLEAGDVLLGVAGPEPGATTVTLSPHRGFVLTTDGLIERRGPDLTDALNLLRGVVATSADLSPDDLADRLLERFDAYGAEDDVAVVVVRRTATG